MRFVAGDAGDSAQFAVVAVRIEERQGFVVRAQDEVIVGMTEMADGFFRGNAIVLMAVSAISQNGRPSISMARSPRSLD